MMKSSQEKPYIVLSCSEFLLDQQIEAHLSSFQAGSNYANQHACLMVL